MNNSRSQAAWTKRKPCYKYTRIIYFVVYSDMQICFIWKKCYWLTFCCHRTSKNTVEGLKLWNQHCLHFFFPLLHQTCILIHQNTGDIFPISNRLNRVLKWLLALVCDQIRSYFELSPSVSVIRNTLWCLLQLAASCYCLFLCVKPTPLGDLSWGWSWSLFIVMG